MLTKSLAIALKDALIRFSNPGEWLFFLILPVLFTFVLGGGLGGEPDANTERLLLVVNEAQGSLATDFVADIEASDQVRVEGHPLAEAESLLADESGLGLLVIPANFDTSLIEGNAISLSLQLRNTPDAALVQQTVDTALRKSQGIVQTAQASVQEAEDARAFASDDERQRYFEESMALAREKFLNPPDLVEVTVPENSIAQLDSSSTAAHQSAGQLVTWVLIPLLGTSSLLAGERMHGTLARILTLPVTSATYLLGTIMGQLGLALIQMVLLVLFGTFVMGINWGNSPAGLAIMMVSFGLAAVAMGTMIGTFTENPMQAGNLSIMSGMLMALLGGCWWPRELFPEVLANIVQILPTTWAMQGFSDLVIRGLMLEAVLPEALILLGFSVLFFAIGVSRFRFE